MGIMDQMLEQVSGANIEALASKVGLTPQQVTSALAALGRAEAEPEDTAGGAAAKTGLPVEKVQQLLQAIGGEDGLRRIVGGLSQGGGLASAMTGLFGKV